MPPRGSCWGAGVAARRNADLVHAIKSNAQANAKAGANGERPKVTRRSCALNRAPKNPCHRHAIIATTRVASRRLNSLPYVIANYASTFVMVQIKELLEALT